MHLQDERHVVARPDDRPPVVVDPGAVGGADVDEPGAGLLHHLGDPERPTDLDRLAPGHGDVATIGERSDHEQHGGRVVVDDDRRLGAAQPGEQLADGALARSALAGGEVELDGLGAAAA